MMTAEEWTALRLSFQVAACAALAGLPFAVAAGYLLARRRFRGKWLLETVLDLPLVLPPVVVGYLLLVAFAPDGPLGAALWRCFGLKVVFNWLGAAIASTVMSFPLAVRRHAAGLPGRRSAAGNGRPQPRRSRWRAFLTVSLPLARRGLIAATLLAFARSLGEFGATIMIAGNIEGQTRTIPLAIYSLVQRPEGLAGAWRLVGLSILLACGALALGEWMERKSTDGPVLNSSAGIVSRADSIWISPSSPIIVSRRFSGRRAAARRRSCMSSPASCGRSGVPCGWRAGPCCRRKRSCIARPSSGTSASSFRTPCSSPI